MNPLTPVRRGPQLGRDYARLPADEPAPAWLRKRPVALESQFADCEPGSRDAIMARIEAVLFCAEDPIGLRRLAALADLPDSQTARRGLDELQAAYETEGSSLQIVELAGGFQLLTRTDFYPWLTRMRQSAGEARLTGSLLESLAIVAYRQPIMRADMESIRGVHCGEALRELMERGLVRIAGRDDSLGRPMLYATTKKFLQVFGLRDLGDLPPLAAER